MTPTCSKRSTSTANETPTFLKRAEPDKSELTRSIIGTIGDVDAYQLPDAKGYTSMERYLAGETDEIRQRRRDEILGASVTDFRAFAGFWNPQRPMDRWSCLAQSTRYKPSTLGVLGSYRYQMQCIKHSRDSISA